MTAAPSSRSGDHTLRPARADETSTISGLALRSKAYWGYDAAFLEACRAELTYTAAECSSGRLVVAERAGRVTGFYLLGESTPEGELAALFVEPDSIGTGLGRILLTAALEHARRRGCVALTLDADPGAEAFYSRFGFTKVGTVPSGSIAGRVLPRMRIGLAAGDGRPSRGQAKASTSQA